MEFYSADIEIFMSWWNTLYNADLRCSGRVGSQFGISIGLVPRIHVIVHRLYSDHVCSVDVTAPLPPDSLFHYISNKIIYTFRLRMPSAFAL
jgi:hypothetical protein